MRLTKFAPQFDVNPADVKNWMQQPTVVLRTHYAETKPRSAREFSRLNVLELALMSAFVRVGYKPSSAAAAAEPFVDWYRATLQVRARYLVIPSDRGCVHEVHTLEGEFLAKIMDCDGPLALSIIDLGLMVDRLEKLFEEAE